MKDIYHKVESYTPHVWNHICVNMYDLVSANSELSSARKAGSSVYIKVISISRPLYVDDIWIGRVPLTGTSISLYRTKNATDLLQVVNFTGLSQLVNKLQNCQFHQVTTSLLKSGLLQLVTCKLVTTC